MRNDTLAAYFRKKYNAELEERPAPVEVLWEADDCFKPLEKQNAYWNRMETFE